MPRSLTTAMVTALSATQIKPAYFVSIQFANETVYLWTGVGSTTFNSQTYSGLGSLLSISTIDEGTTVEAKGVVITLSGCDTSLLPEVLNQTVLGSPVTIVLALYDASGTIVSSPATIWSGRLDQPKISVGAESFTIELACESRLMDMNVPCNRVYTNEDLQLTTPGDLGCSFVSSLAQRTLNPWGTPWSRNM